MRLDVVILGGGIAGLWLLARLRARGYRALLLEQAQLGAGQTLASQGIIHGGLKYAIDRKLGQDSAALADMPARWRACLAGSGEINLGPGLLAAERHLFWARRNLASRMAGFFGSKLVRGRVETLPPEAWPTALRDPQHVGAVYALDECVLDVPALLARLLALNPDAIKQVNGETRLSMAEDHVVLDCLDGDGRPRRLQASHVVATAGAGNEALLARTGLAPTLAQRRPLQMLLLDNAPAPLWAHCFDTSDKPRVTITTHHRHDGSLVWYVGGLLAEQGASQDEATLIQAARREFALLLPRLDFSHSRYAGLRVDRAEGATDDGSKPEGPVLRQPADWAGRCLLAWPTKLALAPQLADQVLALLPPPAAADAAIELADWPAPGIAAAPWDCAAWREAA
ncbi:FAD-dependent oxidoreductase [Ferrovibrio sp.]|uniref:FAD-dependent oxidoreductase n=1 Tax=Ferrovibrio sp. TaxID=1917215 RepID=UPI001B3DE4A0|nr:FAD-dependent oxidoreductase [Ferrovibrio sp.]MBP7065325.1 FAD-dependent oxidoreductase [Ferrovibrio sp.]